MRERKTRKLVMYGLIVALMATTVAYAVLQTTLNINGTVTKKGGSWNIYFTNLSTPSKASGALTGEASVANPSLSATSFTFEATLVKPLDSIVYTFDVVNDGTIDAELDSITLTGVEEAKEKDITYTLTYADGKAIAKGDALASKETKTLKLTLSYDDVETLDSEDSVLDVGATLVYVQASDNALNGEVEGYKVAVDLHTETTEPATVTLVKDGTDVAFVSPKVVRLGSDAMLADNETNSYPMTYNEQTKKYEAVVPETGTYSIVAEAKNHLPYTMTNITVDSHKDFTITLVGGDINGDGVVNFSDKLLIITNYNTNNTEYDLTGDGIIDDFDLLVVINNNGKQTSYEGLPPVVEPGSVSFDVDVKSTTTNAGNAYKLVVSLNNASGDFRVLKLDYTFDNSFIKPINKVSGDIIDIVAEPTNKTALNRFTYMYFNEETEEYDETKATWKETKWTVNDNNTVKVESLMYDDTEQIPESGTMVFEMYFTLAEGKTFEDITKDSFNIDFMAYGNGASHYYGHNDESLNTITVNDNVGK